MSTDDGAPGAIDQDDPLFQYVTGPPLPRSSIDQNDIASALTQLGQAATVATTPDGTGRRWVPGVSIVVIGRENHATPVLHCKGYGTKSVETHVPVGPDTLFPCASLSKPVSATLIASAMRSTPGLTWDSVVKRPILDIPLRLDKSPAPQTTLRQWLSHRSGLPDHAGDLIEDMNPAMPRQELIDRIVRYQTDIEPGRYRYTNFGFTMGCVGAAWALAAADWEAFAANELTRLGMPRATYGFVSAFDDTEDRVFPHQGKPENPDLLRLDPVGWTWRVVDREHERNPSRQAPAGSFLSSASDLGQFLFAHLNRWFGDFPPRNPPPEETAGRSYSLGWNVTNRSGEDAFTSAVNAVSFSHSGAFSLGAATFLRFDPDAGIGVAILSNGEPTGVPEALGQLFFQYLYGRPLPAGCDHAGMLALYRVLMMNALYEQKIANEQRYRGKTKPIPDTIPHGEVFRGHSDYYACDIVIERRGDGLFLTMGRSAQGAPPWNLRLECFDPATSTFVYATKGENEVGLSAIRFVYDGGVIVRVVDDWLNGIGPGEPGTGLGVIERVRRA